MAEQDLNRLLGQYGEIGDRARRDQEQMAEMNYRLRLAYQKKIQADEAKGYEALRKTQEKAQSDLAKKRRKEDQKAADELIKKYGTAGEKFGVAFREAAARNLDKASKAAKQTVSAAFAGMEKYMGTYASYMSGIEARIQGTDLSFSKMVSDFNKAVGSSRFVKQTEILQNLSSLV